MLRRFAVSALLVACTGAPAPQLVLDGPATVTVDHLGPVEGPTAVLSDGKPAEGHSLSVVPDTVAAVTADGVQAVGAGKAEVTVSWKDQSVTWTLVVDPPVALRLVDPPARLPVGARQPLHVEASVAGKAVEPGELVWTSTAPEVAAVEESVLVAKGVGITYVVVRHGASEAMAEITVVEP